MRWALIIAVLFTAPACAHGGKATEQELSRLRREVHALKKDLADARDEIRALDRKVARSPASPPPAVAGPVPSGPRSVPSGPGPRLPVVRLTADSNRGEDDEALDAGALDDGRPPILIKLGPSTDPDGEVLPVDRSVLAEPDPVLHGPTPEDQYREALETLRDGKDPQRAKAMFIAFEAAHPTSSLADNAAYWLGEAHFALAEYEAAIACFERVERRYPRSSKVPYARLRWGESLLRLSRRGPAEARLRSVVEQHPDSPAADEAAQLLADAGAKGNM